MNTITCPEKIQGPGFGNFQSCGRPLRNEEQREAGLCGVHLRAKKRREEKEESTRRALAASAEAQRRAQAACEKLYTLGIYAEPHYRVPFGAGMGSYTGMVIVDGDKIIEALDRE